MDHQRYGPQFISRAYTKFYDKFKMQNVFSPSYNPAVNGQAEAFNKIIIQILQNFVTTSQRDWNEKLRAFLWAYHITVRTQTRVTPFSLVYECEAVLPLEIHIPSFHVELVTRMTTKEKYSQ